MNIYIPSYKDYEETKTFPIQELPVRTVKDFCLFTNSVRMVTTINSVSTDILLHYLQK